MLQTYKISGRPNGIRNMYKVFSKKYKYPYQLTMTVLSIIVSNDKKKKKHRKNPFNVKKFNFFCPKKKKQLKTRTPIFVLEYNGFN